MKYNSFAWHIFLANFWTNDYEQVDYIALGFSGNTKYELYLLEKNFIACEPVSINLCLFWMNIALATYCTVTPKEAGSQQGKVVTWSIKFEVVCTVIFASSLQEGFICECQSNILI